MDLVNTASNPATISTKPLVQPRAKDEIAFAIGQSELGLVLVARSFDGICSILIGSDAQELESDLATRFPEATLTRNDEELEHPLRKALRFIERPAEGLSLELDIRGTLFQRRVWAVLCTIPAGQMITYAALAARLGEPKSVRAVANACAANAIALAIPCPAW